jgi:hypothetical protein
MNDSQKESLSDWQRTAPDTPRIPKGTTRLLLPSTLLVAIGTQLFAPFMLVDFAFATFF